VTVTQTQAFAALGFFPRALPFVPLAYPARYQDRGVNLVQSGAQCTIPFHRGKYGRSSRQTDPLDYLCHS
jgi:hypothetical protein